LIARTVAKVDKGALLENTRLLKNLSNGARISAVVKDNAYGHGVDWVVESLADLVDAFSVATVAEGIQLRELGVQKPVWILTGFCNLDELDEIKRYRLTTVVNSDFQIDQISARSWREPVLLEIDSGMGRLGLSKHEVGETLWTKIRDFNIVALMSHYSSADRSCPEAVREQLRLFEELTEGTEYPRSISNSGGIFCSPASAYQWVRPGLALFGISPFSDKGSLELGLRPAMEFESCLLSIRTLSKGDPVGYGSTWVCPEEMKVGIVGCGYGDGYPRNLGNLGIVSIGSCKVDIIGRISMDSFAVDLRACPDCQIGERVTLWGKELPIELVAERAKTIPNELMVRVTNRVPRVPIDTS